MEQTQEQQPGTGPGSFFRCAHSVVRLEELPTWIDREGHRTLDTDKIRFRCVECGELVAIRDVLDPSNAPAVAWLIAARHRRRSDPL